MAVQVFSEFSILMFGELLAALSFMVPDRKPTTTLNQFLTMPRYVVRGILGGGALGLISLWLAPHNFIQSKVVEIAYTLIIPFVGGFFMAIAMESKLLPNKNFLRVNTFLFGFSFALTLAIVRLIYAH